VFVQKTPKSETNNQIKQSTIGMGMGVVGLLAWGLLFCI